MNISIFLAAQAGGGAGASGGGGGFSFLIMMLAVFAIMWFFMIRPQQKKQKEIRNFQNQLQVGTKVVTGGGIYGTVKHLDIANNKVTVEISKGVDIVVDKSYVFADTNVLQAVQPVK